MIESIHWLEGTLGIDSGGTTEVRIYMHHVEINNLTDETEDENVSLQKED